MIVRSHNMNIFQWIKKYSKDPKTGLEVLLLLALVTIGYFYIYVYQNMLHINVKFLDLNELMKIGFIEIVIVPLIYYVIIKSDPLQRSTSEKKSIKFFQNQFPSKYLIERCARCVEDENSCPNYIKAGSFDHIKYWFNDIFHGVIEKESPEIVKETFGKGYTCKLVYNSLLFIGIFFLLGVGVILYHHISLYLSGTFKVDVTAFQIIFLLVAVFMIVLIRAFNSPDENKPSGCWHAWREINGIHISWLEHRDGGRLTPGR